MCGHLIRGDLHGNPIYLPENACRVRIMDSPFQQSLVFISSWAALVYKIGIEISKGSA
jgi:hypothetical protein